MEYPSIGLFFMQRSLRQSALFWQNTPQDFSDSSLHGSGSLFAVLATNASLGRNGKQRISQLC